MYQIISSLKDSKLFSSIKVIELIDEGSVQLLEIRATMSNGTLLYITELRTLDYQKYSYHWQRENGEMIMRWDNKPHWKNLSTFPHHRHEMDTVHPSHRIEIEEVIKAIGDQIGKNEAEYEP